MNTNDVLNRAAAIMEGSLPMYLHFARPTRLRGDERAAEALDLVAADQQAMVDRIVALLEEHAHPYVRAEFPMEFTSLHDLSTEYLLGRVIECQQQDISALEACTELLSHAPMAKAIAEEALGLAVGHLENLKEVADSQSAVA